MPPNYFFAYAHAVTVPFQAIPLSATASTMAQPCSSLAQSARPASPVRMHGIADAVVWRLQRSPKRHSLDIDTTLYLQKPFKI
jgi:hypothetical protein